MVATMMTRTGRLLVRTLLLVIILAATTGAVERQTQTGNDSLRQKGDAVAKLVFIHHSVGGNWLAHDYGGLVSALNRQGFYVNDITYGWQPAAPAASWAVRAKRRLADLLGSRPSGADRIGDRTDIGQLYDWFSGPDAAAIMAAVYRENNETGNYGDHANRTSATPLSNPGMAIENEVVMIKPCYPNSLYKGTGNDPPAAGTNPPRNFVAGSDQHTIANCKRIYNDILAYFASRPDKFFVIVTAPPQSELPEDGRIAREFSTWLVRDWLNENNYQTGNVMVFDLFNVLTSGIDWRQNDLGAVTGNHHRLIAGVEQHRVASDNNLLAYPRDGINNHPSPAGLQKATAEFTGLLVQHFSNWKARVRM